MKRVEIYTTPLCGYCHAAKRLLARKGVAFTETDVTDPVRRAAMVARSSGTRSRAARTWPAASMRCARAVRTSCSGMMDCSGNR
mgnify:CR=1 FL=1